MSDGYVTWNLNGGSTTPSGDSKVFVAGDYWIDGANKQLVTWDAARINFGNAEASNLVPNGTYGYTPSESDPETPGSGLWKIKIPKNIQTLALEGFSGGVNADLSGFDNLESLTLIDCGLTAIPDLTGCTKLKAINLNGNPIGMSFPGFTDFYSLTSLNSIKFKDMTVLTDQIPDLDDFPDLTEYIYTPNDVKNDITIEDTDVDWNYITLDWDDLPLVQNDYTLKRDNVAVYTGPLFQFTDTGLSQGVTYNYEVSNDYFGNVIFGFDVTTTDACSPPDPNELGMYVNPGCGNLDYSWSNNWRDSPNRSDLAMSLSLFESDGTTLVEGPINILNLTDYDFTNLFSDTTFVAKMTITKCGQVQEYSSTDSTMICNPPTDLELNLRQI